MGGLAMKNEEANRLEGCDGRQAVPVRALLKTCE